MTVLMNQRFRYKEHSGLRAGERLLFAADDDAGQFVAVRNDHSQGAVGFDNVNALDGDLIECVRPPRGGEAGEHGHGTDHS